MSTCGSSSLDRLSGLKLSTLSMRPERNQVVRDDGVQFETPDVKPLSLTSFPPHPHTALPAAPSWFILLRAFSARPPRTVPCSSPRSSTVAPCQPHCSLPLLQEAFPVPSPSSQSDHSSENGLGSAPIPPWVWLFMSKPGSHAAQRPLEARLVGTS